MDANYLILTFDGFGDGVALPPNFRHKPCIINSTNIQAYDKTSHSS